MLHLRTRRFNSRHTSDTPQIVDAARVGLTLISPFIADEDV